MNVKVVAQALIVTSDITLAKFNDLKNFAANALKIEDDNGNQTYLFDYKNGGCKAQLDPKGVVFNATDDGKLCLTLLLCGTNGDSKKYVIDNYGNALANLKAAEALILGRFESAMQPIEEIKSMIQG